MTTSVRFCLSYDPLKLDFIAFKMSFTSKRKCIAYTDVVSDVTYTPQSVIVYAHGRRLCSNWFRHGSATISYPQCSLTFLRECCLHRCLEQSFAIRAYAMSAVGIDVVSTVSTDIVSSHTKHCRIAYDIIR